VLVLGFNAIAVIKATVAAEAVAAVDTKIKANTFFIRSLTAEAEALLAFARDDDVRAVCKEVHETLRYSDPMSHVALEGCEREISLRFAAFSDAVKQGDVAYAKETAAQVTALAKERNAKCKLLK